MGDCKVLFRVLVEWSECKRALGRRLSWENIKMYLREIRIDAVNWIRLAQIRVRWRAFVSTEINLRVPERKQAIV
jgi:hypothetical protein